MAAFVTPQGHLVTAQAINFFAPDSELHGVLARQRELAELATSIAGARSAAEAAREALAAIDADTARFLQIVAWETAQDYYGKQEISSRLKN